MFRIASFLLGAVSAAVTLAGTALFASNEFDKARGKLKKALEDIKRYFGDGKNSITQEEKTEKE